MANRTLKEAKSIKGTNPQYLVEKIIRTRIYDCQYWKEKCFALSAELLVDEAMSLDHVGGVFGGNIKPTPFICLILKMLQIQPSKDIIIEFIRNPDYKYVRVLGALYLRIVGTSIECYKYLEPLLNDYRKLKFKNRQGKLELSHVDDFIDKLLHEDRVCDVILPRIQRRHILEETEQLEPRVSALDDDLEGEESDEEEEQVEQRRSLSPEYHRHRSRSRSKSPHRRRSRSRSPRRRSRSRSRSRSPAYHRSKRRSRSRSPPRRHHDDRHSKRSPSPTYRRRRSRSPDRDDRRKRDKERNKERDRERDRVRDKERDRERDKERGTDRDRDSEKKEKKHDKDKEKKSSKKSKKKSDKKERTAEEEEEIRQANELRAKLGLKPLRE